MATWAELEREDPDLGAFGGEFMVRGWMEQVAETHPAAQRFVHDAPYPLAFYAMSVKEAVGTTYEGEDLAPVYRRWRPGGSGSRSGRRTARA